MKENELVILMEEYRKLKEEQISRIGFRDNLIYVTLVAIGGIISFVLSNKIDYIVLLVIPWVCLILGWTYLVNDEKISSIGKYIKENLTNTIKPHLTQSPFGWENFHVNDNRRTRRKIVQLLIDEITFILPGAVAILTYCVFQISFSPFIITLMIFEGLLLLYLAIEIINYSKI